MVGETFHDVLIVGAGHAGAQCAAALRQCGYAGSIGLLGDEPDPPYERPPLSKDYLSGERTLDRIALRPPTFWTERTIDLLLDRRVTQVDVEAHIVTLADRRRHGYGHLVWATGGRPRRLTCEGADLGGVHTVRTRADVDGIRAQCAGVDRIVLVGGGYVGLEVAAVLNGLGKTVTVLEFQDRVLARVAGVVLSRFIEAEHVARGVDVRLGVGVERIEGRGGAVSGVRLTDGTEMACRTLIVGIGVDPTVGPLVAAGAMGTDGVLVDAHGQTSLKDVFAIGDCAAQARVYADGAIVRLESVQNANDQAAATARFLSGAPETPEALPWFWSHQYDLKLQTIGLSTGHDSAVVRGKPSSRQFSVLYLKQGRVIALDCVNSVRDYVQGRALIQSGCIVDPADLANSSLALKDLSASASAATLQSHPVRV